MLLNSLWHLAQEAGNAIAKTPPRIPAAMPVINPYLIAGGAVAAFVVVAKYPARAADTPKARVLKRTTLFFLTFFPGVIVAQLAYDILLRQVPIVKEIPSLPLGMGAVLGGCGLPILLGLWRRLPTVVVDKALSTLNPTSPTTNPAKTKEPTDTPEEEGTEKDL